MTSYPGRITNVGKAIYLLLTKQTRKPDEIHLWLAEPEFPNREKDLPQDLQIMLHIDNLFLHWLPKNTYCHKRHEIFHIATEDDCIFIIDDDTYYANSLIETVMKWHEKYPNAVISYNSASIHKYAGKHILYPGTPMCQPPRVNFGRINGNSMFPFKVMPKAVYERGYEETRDKCTPICDESWITPWLVYFDVPIIWLNFGWGVEINHAKVDMNKGLVSQTHKIEANGLERRDNWLANVLDAFPKIKEKYERLFNYGK